MTPAGNVPVMVPSSSTRIEVSAVWPESSSVTDEAAVKPEPVMVIAVATASPLFTDGIPASATERDYLTALRKTLLYKPDPNQPDRVVDAVAFALTTRDRGR